MAPVSEIDTNLSIPRTESPELLSPQGPLRGFAHSLTPPKLAVSFTDSEFPPTTVSIGKTSAEDSSSRLHISVADRDTARWIRLPEYIKTIHNITEPIELFGDIEPNDLTQGIVGDCWLLATMACLAEFPSAIESLFVESDIDSGRYVIRLYNLDAREWTDVTIDDYIPCRLENDYSHVPFHLKNNVRLYDSSVAPEKKLRPLFAVPNGNQMWAALLEKAVAKFVGTYAQLAGGHEPFAMIAFTGFPQVYQFKRPPIDLEKTIAHPTEWERGWAQWAGKFSPSCGYRPILDLEKRAMDSDFVWQRLLEYDQMNYLLAASIVCYTPDSQREDGLVPGHAYSLLSAAQFDTYRLVKLRNPHGKGTRGSPTEWNGQWSDKSPEWQLFPSIARQAGHTVLNDGIFWMPFEDFVKIFDKILVLPFSMGEPRGALSSVRRAKHLDSKRTAQKAVGNRLGMAMENQAHVSTVVKAVHLMSVHPYDPYLNAPDWVTRDPAVYTRWAHEKLGTKKDS